MSCRASVEVYRPPGQRVHAATAHLPDAERRRVVAALERMAEAFDAARAGLAGP